MLPSVAATNISHKNSQSSQQIDFSTSCGQSLQTDACCASLTNACIIVSVVCFLGVVMAVVIGIAICYKLNSSCNRRSCSDSGTQTPEHHQRSTNSFNPYPVGRALNARVYSLRNEGRNRISQDHGGDIRLRESSLFPGERQRVSNTSSTRVPARPNIYGSSNPTPAPAESLPCSSLRVNNGSLRSAHSDLPCRPPCNTPTSEWSAEVIRQRDSCCEDNISPLARLYPPSSLVTMTPHDTTLGPVSSVKQVSQHSFVDLGRPCSTNKSASEPTAFCRSWVRNSGAQKTPGVQTARGATGHRRSSALFKGDKNQGTSIDSWTTAKLADERNASLEWDNFQPSLEATNPDLIRERTLPQSLLDYAEHWV